MQFDEFRRFDGFGGLARRSVGEGGFDAAERREP
jgi:hypothetical protein